MNLDILLHAQNLCESELTHHGPLTVLGDGIWKAVNTARMYHTHLWEEKSICIIRALKKTIFSNQKCFSNSGSIHGSSFLLEVPLVRLLTFLCACGKLKHGSLQGLATAVSFNAAEARYRKYGMTCYSWFCSWTRISKPCKDDLEILYLAKGFTSPNRLLHNEV